MDGYIKLYRKICDNWLWADKPFSKGQAWIDLLIMANHADGKFPLGNELFHVSRGQVVTSEVILMKRWGWSKSKVRAFLSMLEKDSMILKKTDRKKTTLTLCNYSVYADSQTTEEPQKDREQTAKEPQPDTIKNVKKKENVKKEDIPNGISKKESEIRRFIPPTAAEVQAYCAERRNGVDVQMFVDFYEAKGWMVGKNKMKDWKAAVRTWERRGGGAKAKEEYADVL